MITNSKIAHGDQLGAQLSTLANLIYLSEINNQKIVFYEELINFRRGFQFLDVFKCEKIEVIKVHNFFSKFCLKRFRRIEYQDWKKNMKAAYFSKLKYYKDKLLYEIIKLLHKDFVYVKDLENGIHCDKMLMSLEDDKNYDIINGFGTYQDWKKCENRVKNEFTFKDEIVKKGDALFSSIDFQGKNPVSVHFRLADYLVLSSLKLKPDYYKKALEQYDTDNTIFLIFSDEIEKVKKLDVFENRNVIYMNEKNDAAIDMYLMTRCTGGNIIANSSFSFWGAFLNSAPHKKVVCPHDFVNDTTVNYINGNYYPNEWIGL